MFGWLKKIFYKFSVKKSHNYMFAHNLDEWVYLGKSVINYTDENKIVVKNTNVYFFTDKSFVKRSYYLLDKNYFKYHPFMNYCDEWKYLNVDKIHSPIQTPSIHLIEYMKKLGYVWSNQKNWWTVNISTVVDSVKSNVIKLKLKQNTTEKPVDNNNNT